MLAATIYVLGLVALCWPIYRKITNDASTALYAVSLMPKTLVAGQGVRILFGLPFLVTASCICLGVIQNIGTKALTSVAQTSWAEWAIVILVALITVLAFSRFVISAQWAFSAFDPRGTARWANWLSFGVTLVAGVVAGLLVISTFFQSEAILPRLPEGSLMLKNLIIIFALNSVGAFIVAFSSEAPLPTVALNGSDSVEGKLVAHTEGVWYFLDESGNLVGVPDEKAGRVVVPP